MSNWGHICRICSSPADYEIFAKIPTYLHGSTNEFLNFQKPINLLLEETTGLKNSPDDGLPRFICALCISYLKHCVTFREQCIRNAISLKLAGMYQEKSTSDRPEDKEQALFTAEDLKQVEQRPVHNLLLNNNNSNRVDATDKVHKQLLNQSAPQVGGSSSDNDNEQRIRYLNVLFDQQRSSGRNQTKAGDDAVAAGSGNGTPEDDYVGVSSSDDNEGNALSRRHKNCYNYSETNFEDDDPLAELQSRDIKVNVPQPMWKERKCPACAKRFMFEDSYQQHVDNCVEQLFVQFVGEVTRLLDIRRQKMVSPHEFIRRMIFALHKTCTWLQEHSIDTVLAEKLNQVKVAMNGNGNGHGRSTEVVGIPVEWVTKQTSKIKKEDGEVSPFTFTDSTLAKDISQGRGTPITVDNNVLYAIERSASRNSQQSVAPVVKKPIPILGTQLGAQAAFDRAHFLEKLQKAVVTPQPLHLPATPNAGSATGLTFSARCGQGQCNMSFDSVTDLEKHNKMHHNEQKQPQVSSKQTQISAEEAQRRKIIALFEDDI